MKKSEFFYELPQVLIAQHPIEPRDTSRIMILNKYNGQIEHKIFKDVVKYLKKGDCLVLNDTRVIPARLIGAKKETGGKIEFLLLKRIDKDTWEALTKPGKKAIPGAVFEFGNGKLEAEVLEILEEGIRKVKFNYNGIFEEILDELGQMPLPPYITEKLEDKERYQTVYSKQSGSAAAPTAGLHFTNELLEKIKQQGVEVAFVTLHVGLGTFRPVKEEEIEEHPMHSEFYSITKESADRINNIKANGGRVICVGTTSCRVIESVADERGKLSEKSGWTEIFIYPGYKFKILDCLITNFHLPESTLVMLVSSLAGRENILNAYKEAVNEKYRFFSFGDAMFITDTIEERSDV